jgi:RNA polymerase sigma factor (sigma-70 family)
MEQLQISSASFEDFIRDSSTYLFSLSYRLTGSYDEARDLLQETCIKAWHKWDRLRDKEKAIPWLRKICVNQYIDTYRKSKHEYIVRDPVFPHMEYEIASTAPSPEEELIADEEIRLIHSQCFTIMTKTLPMHQHIVFLLIDIYHIGVEETARLIGKSPSATKSLLHRARKAMSGLISPYCSLLNQNNICKCESWIRYSHDIQKRREALQQMVSTHTHSKEKLKSAQESLMALFSNLPQHLPSSSWIDEIIKKFR